VGATGEPSQQPALACGTQSVHYAWVKHRSTFDQLSYATVVYQHMQMSNSTPFSITFTGDGTFDTATYNNHFIGSTVADSGCWAGYHVHENNRDTSMWVGWNTNVYDSATENCDCYDVDDKNMWTRRVERIETL